MNTLNIHPVKFAYGTLPPDFAETASGHLPYTQVYNEITLDRDDVDAVSFDNIHLLSESERLVVKEVVQFFAHNPSSQQVILQPA